MANVGCIVEVQEASVEVDSVPLLYPISFTVDAGGSVAVRGSNGAGKTTLLRLLAGLSSPSSGSVRIAGRDVDERDSQFRRTVAGLIGSPPVAHDLTLQEHLSLVAASWGAGTSQSWEKAEQLLHDVGLLALANRFPHEVSSGQAQLFSFALTLSRPFEVLLLDEPEQRLDPDRLAIVIRLLQGLIDEGKTVIFSTHNPLLVETVANRTIELSGVSV